MPRNYDELAAAEEDSFVIRGETFKFRRVPYTVLDQIDVLQKEFVESGPETYAAAVEFAQNRLLLLLDSAADAVARWKALTSREDDPVTYKEIMQISRWAYEVATGLPTMQPTPSDAGQQKTPATSKAG